VQLFRGRLGAPVTFRGVPVGEVKTLGVRLDPRTGRSIILGRHGRAVGTDLHLAARWFFSCTAAGGTRAGRTELDVPLASATPAAVTAATTAALDRFADLLVDAMPAECRPFAARA